MIVNPTGTTENPSTLFECICGKTYKYDSGYYRHKKTCEMVNAVPSDTKIDIDKKDIDKKDKDANIELVQEHDNDLDKISEKEMLMMFMKEMKTTMIEMFKHLQPVNNTTTSNNIHNNSHNKTFNLQFFLNEQCKDALNINEFVDSIKLQLSDLEDTGRLGYVDGISKIILKNLQDMDKFKRPIH